VCAWLNEAVVARSKEFEPEAVLGRAMDVFWERGYENSSLQDLS
jgi:TetR/AcrR family transcriptional repressor of nem operon